MAEKRPSGVRLGPAQLTMLRRLNRALNPGGNVGGIVYDPGAEAPRKTLDALVAKGLAWRVDRGWTLSRRGVDECFARGWL